MKEPFILKNNSSKRIGFLIQLQKEMKKAEFGFLFLPDIIKSIRTSDNLGKVFIITQESDLLILKDTA
jgi:hypothetical protein